MAALGPVLYVSLILEKVHVSRHSYSDVSGHSHISCPDSETSLFPLSRSSNIHIFFLRVQLMVLLHPWPSGRHSVESSIFMDIASLQMCVWTLACWGLVCGAVGT